MLLHKSRTLGGLGAEATEVLHFFRALNLTLNKCQYNYILKLFPVIFQGGVGCAPSSPPQSRLVKLLTIYYIEHGILHQAMTSCIRLSYMRNF